MNYIPPRSALACLQELLPASVMDYKLAWNPTGMAKYLCSVLIAQTLPTNVQSEQKSEYHYLPLYFIYLYVARAGISQTTAVAGIQFPKLIYSSSHSQWVMLYYSISSSIDFKSSIREVPFLVHLSVSRFGPMVEMQKELLYCCVLKCVNNLKKALLQSLPQKLIIVQNTDEAEGMLVLQYFISLQKQWHMFFSYT